MLEKTPEQLMEQNLKIQNDIWLKGKRVELRMLALETTRGLNISSASEVLNEADKIYDWLIKAL